MLIDTHCHLVSHKYPPAEIAAIVARAKDAGVGKIVSLATGLADVEENLRLASEFDLVRACLGIHPCHVHEEADDVVAKLRVFGDDDRVCAVGETGLDYFHPAPEGWNEGVFRHRQRWMLEEHFSWGAEAGLGVVVHTRDREGTASFEDALEIYGRYAHRVKAMFHCFIGTAENAQRVFDLGGILSFGGVATFKNAKNVLAVVAELPPGTFTLETDAPYLAPVPFRGQRNEPAMVKYVAECIALARGESFEELCQHTSQTAAQFFRW